MTSNPKKTKKQHQRTKIAEWKAKLMVQKKVYYERQFAKFV